LVHRSLRPGHGDAARSAHSWVWLPWVVGVGISNYDTA
jgi:hypothetical protein